MTDNSKKMVEECWSCKHKRPVAGNAHIQCVKPDELMTGERHGIKSGWFIYPSLFDPIWKTKLCDNYEAENSDAISDADNGVVSGS